LVKKLNIFTKFDSAFTSLAGIDWNLTDTFFLIYVLKIMLINPCQQKSTYYFIYKSIIKYCDIAIFVVRELPLL